MGELLEVIITWLFPKDSLWRRIATGAVFLGVIAAIAFSFRGSE